MRRSVHDRHLMLNPSKELVEVDIEAFQEDPKSGDGR
jgi:hypothetical protein